MRYGWKWIYKWYEEMVRLDGARWIERGTRSSLMYKGKIILTEWGVAGGMEQCKFSCCQRP